MPETAEMASLRREAAGLQSTKPQGSSTGWVETDTVDGIASLKKPYSGFAGQGTAHVF